MIKNNFKVKEQITLADKINAINTLVNGYFTDGVYTPYFREINDIIVFFTYCVDGITFEKTVDGNGNETDESVYMAAINDPELMKSYKAVKKGRPGYETLLSQLSEIDEQVKDIVEFEKSRYSSAAIAELIVELIGKAE